MTSAEKRAEMIAGIRALADLLESRPALWMPYGIHGTAFPPSTEGVFDSADLLGVPVERVYGAYPRVIATVFLHPKVSYQVYESIQAPATESEDPVVVTREQMLAPSPDEAADGLEGERPRMTITRPTMVVHDPLPVEKLTSGMAEQPQAGEPTPEPVHSYAGLGSVRCGARDVAASMIWADVTCAACRALLAAQDGSA
jgi:hypothetical protein